MQLKELFNKYGCDKSSKHGYDTVYQPLFEPLQNKEINILEVGVFKGASTRAFYEFFPKANIYALDIFVRTSAKDIEVLRENRCHWLKADSTNPSVRSQIKTAFPNVEFDIILDDGLHTPKANAQTFNNLRPLLKEGGLYIIEDVFPLEKMTMKELQHPWLQRYPERYNALDNNDFLTAMDKSGMNIVRHDLRDISGQPDSYIIQLS